MNNQLIQTFKLIAFATIFGVLPIATSAASYGPFEMRYERDPMYQRPPYRTGFANRSCEAMFSASAQSPLAEINERILHLAVTVENQLIEGRMRYMPGTTREDAKKRAGLSCSVCLGASRLLIRELDNAGLRLDVTPYMSRWRIDAIEAKHVYLRVVDYHGAGIDLLIDPTIRQFFVKRLSEGELENNIPLVFVGSEAELSALFKKYFVPTAAAPGMSAGDVVKAYLDALPNPYLFDPDY